MKEILDKNLILDDLFPQRQELLVSLKEKINNFSFAKHNIYDNIENVILIESDFGTGKTFFAKKLNDYLKSDLDSIYFSAWENDYEEQPFMVVSRHIYKYFNNLTTKNKTKVYTENLYSLIKNVGYFIDPRIKEFFEMCEKTIDDPIDEFKKALKKLINEQLKGKKLVLIIDELDRCRPDYAMKVLEVIKHFFDIEGLIIIFFANEKSLYNSIKALYNFDNNDTNGEDYMAKFFMERIHLNPIDYDKYITDRLAKILGFNTDITKNKLTEVNNAFNSLYVLKNSLVELSKMNNITCRELNKITDKVSEFYNKRKDKDDNDWKYIVNEIFRIYFVEVLGKREYSEYHGYQENKNSIKLFSVGKSENIFYYSFSQYSGNKLNILNPERSYDEILKECDILQYSIYSNLYHILLNKKKEIFFCFRSPINLNEKMINVDKFKEYFKLAQERNEILKSYDNLKLVEIEKLKEILLKYDQEVENFKNMYGDTDELTEEEFNKRKNNINNTIKEIFFIK